MSKLFYSANGQAFKSTYKNIIERMTETTKTEEVVTTPTTPDPAPAPITKIDNSLDLVGNLEIKGDIKAMRYLDVNGNPLSFADPKGTYTIGNITEQQGQIGIGVSNPRSQLHIGKNLRVEEDIKMNESSNLCFGESCLNNQSLQTLNKRLDEINKVQESKNVAGGNMASELYEITGNIPHPDRGDGMIYRADGQVQFATDDLIRMRHVGSKQTGIQFDTSPGVGLIKNPDGTMKISRSGIMFGGNNGVGKEINSAQISAGIHEPNSLNIVGMSSDAGSGSRKVDVWAEGGMTIRGPINNISDTRNRQELPNVYRTKGQGKYTEFKYNFSNLPGYSVVETIVPWRDVSGGKVKQIIYQDEHIYYRTGTANDLDWEPIKNLS
jgi:hypothetical protein